MKIRKIMILAMVLLVVGQMGQKANAQEVRQAYVIPSGFESYPAGTVLEYGGNDYMISPAHVMYFLSPAPVHQVVAAPASMPLQGNLHERASYSHAAGGPGFFGPGFSRDFHRG